MIQHRTMPMVTPQLEVLDPRQALTAINFLAFRALFPDWQDARAETATRAAAILLARRTAPQSVRLQGLPDPRPAGLRGLASRFLGRG